ncbi:MAG: DMT family transporter [Oscillospiraceae bacterium]|nr:DMT family transporter [Oscillospiraceae bacterium]
MNRTKNLLFFILSMVIFGTNGLIVANISLGSAEIVLMRTFLGSLFLLVIVLAKRSFSFADLKSDLVPATIGGAALGLNWVLLFTAYRSAGVALSTLTYYCGPIIVLALSPVLFKEKLTWNKLLAIAAVAVGMFCISGNIDPGSDVQTGLLCGGGAALLYASLIVANKRVKRLAGLNCAMYELIVAFFVVLIYLIVTNVPLPVIPAVGDILWVLLIGLVNTGLAYYLYFSSLQQLPGQTIALVCYIDPLTALLVSAAFLGEKMLVVQIVGAVLILGGACLGELKFKKSRNNLN